MRLSTTTDVTDMGIQLNELRSKFDHAIREGEIFDNLKQLYSKIKELECYLSALQWDPPSKSTTARNESKPPPHNFVEKKYKYINEPPPLL